MDFTVLLADESTRHFHDTDYAIDDAGVLTVADEDGKIVKYSPTFWLSIGESRERDRPTMLGM